MPVPMAFACQRLLVDLLSEHDEPVVGFQLPDLLARGVQQHFPAAGARASHQGSWVSHPALSNHFFSSASRPPLPSKAPI